MWGFLSTIRDSIVSKEFYLKNYTHSFWERFRYLYFLHLILSVSVILSTVAWYREFEPRLEKFAAEFRQEAPNLYPKELVVTIKDGILSMNQPNPYHFTPAIARDLLGDKRHFITIDTEAGRSDYFSSQSVLLLTKDSVVFGSDRNLDHFEFRAFASNGGSQNIRLDRAAYDSFISSALPYLNRVVAYARAGIAILAFIIILIMPILGVGSWLLMLLVWSLLAYLAARYVLKKEKTYAYVYKMSMYLITAPLLLQFVVSSTTEYRISGVVVFLLYLLLFAIFLPEGSGDPAKDRFDKAEALVSPPKVVSGENAGEERRT
jgi:hypothetical protein